MKHSFMSAMAIACMASATLFFSSCQQDDVLDVQSEITSRTPAPEVPAILEIGEGFEVSYHTYAQGVQVYEVTETAPGIYQWVLKYPIATLYKSANFTGVVGTHYGGPTWESNSGSQVIAARLESVTVDPNAIAWLKLGAVSSAGPGVFDGTTHIQRINTVGGKAPATGASEETLGDIIEVPYTAEYYFYKPE
jgi:hypothetical protein